MAAKTGKSAVKKTAKPKAAPATTGTDLVRRVTWDRIGKKKALPDIRTGDSVGVYVKVKEGEKERVQLFSGVVIKMQGSGINASFTVRKIASGVGVERIFPILSPFIEKVEVTARGRVRRGRLFFLRGLKGRSARLNSEQYFDDGSAPGAADEIATEASEAADKSAAAESSAKKPAKASAKS